MAAQRKKRISISRLTVILLLLALLPALFYTLFEVQNLREKEDTVTAIYRQQLEDILFSVNQYAWDIANNWTNRINAAYLEKTKDNPSIVKSVQELLQSTSAFQAVSFWSKKQNSLTKEVLISREGDEGGNNALLTKSLMAAMETDPELLSRLEKFNKSGYRKISPLFFAKPDGSKGFAIVFVLDRNDLIGYHAAAILIEPEAFIHDFIFPKINEIQAGNDQIVLAAIDLLHPEVMICPSPDLTSADIQYQKPLWIFPQYELGIGTPGQSILDITNQQFRRNLMLLGLLALVLSGGVWFVNRSLRREMELAEMKSDFVSNISHELKTPLALIRLFAESLEMGRVPSKEKQMQYFKIIGQESERLTHLVNNILNFSKMEAGKKTYQFDRVDVNSIAARVIDSYCYHLESNGFSLESNLEDDLPAIRGDENAIFESIINLIDNAMKYSGESRWVGLSTGRKGNAVFLEVADRGVGIPGDQQAHI
ncbi:MAG TPA: HAMP domain-containing sensor histidine kinase, partial [Calditrichia bacterium]|nr:HAMP domain-containing sensor histidine kinase [Calditrichia bacterium]